MIKYVNYGHPLFGPHMFVIVMFKTEHGNYKVEVRPCDENGFAISDSVSWNIFPTWWEARKFVYQQYKEFYRYVNERH